MRIIEYNPATNEIRSKKQTREIPQSDHLNVSDTEWERVHPDTHMIDRSTGELRIVERPTMNGFDRLRIAADQIDRATVDAVPAGTRVRLESDAGLAWHTVNDGILSIGARTPGEFVVDIRPPWPYQKQSVTIIAT